MHNSRNVVLKFVVAGIASGIASGFAAAIRPLGLFLPGLLFGIGILHALQRSKIELTFRGRLALLAASIVAWLVAIVVTLISGGVFHSHNWLVGGAWIGLFGGGAGAFCLSMAICWVLEDVRWSLLVAGVTFTGMILGSLFVVIAVYISDYTRLGHPIDDFVGFLIWQPGVAASIPFFREKVRRGAQ